MMEHGTIFLDVLTISKRLRHLDATKVESIAASMDVLGLQQPISIWAADDGAVVELVAGAHRVAAAQKLGWEKIDCIFVDMDDLDRQLWEIDENLMRAELGPAEMAEHTAKRAKIVRDKAVLAKSAKTKPDPSQNADKGQAEFDQDTATKTGQSPRSVRQNKARGEAIPADVLALIQGTDLDKGTYLDKLKKLERDEMRERVDRDLEAGGRERKSRRTTAEICLDKFHHSIRQISRTGSVLHLIDVPDLDSKQRVTAVADLRNVAKQIQELIKTVQHAHDEDQP
jgi:ParB-like chromosome segregation protein Spo0J